LKAIPKVPLKVLDLTSLNKYFNEVKDVLKLESDNRKVIKVLFYLPLAVEITRLKTVSFSDLLFVVTYQM
jgi:hypothetical protein